MGSWAGLGGGAHRPSGWLDIARWSRRIDLHHRVRLVWGIAPMDGGRGRRGEGWRGGQARSCPSRWGWCWRGGAAPSGLLGRASASEPRRSEFPYAPGRAVRAVGGFFPRRAVPRGLRQPPSWPLLLRADGGGRGGVGLRGGRVAAGRREVLGAEPQLCGAAQRQRVARGGNQLLAALRLWLRARR